MGIDLTNTNAAKISSALLAARRRAGSPAMGMVLTFVVVTDEGDHYDALKAAKAVGREHPSRILLVIRRSPRGAANLDAEVSIGEGWAGETVLLRMSGELAKHPESVVLPLLLPDSPVVVWWPRNPPDDPAGDPIGRLAQRRITDVATVQRGRQQALMQQCTIYADGNTDLAWTRLTPWRALLAAALDQYPARIRRGRVAAEHVNPSADLLAAWLIHRLGVPIERTRSKGPGITSVTLETGGGEISISRPDGRLAQFTLPNGPARPVALKRRETDELLAEELRRLDPDDTYAASVRAVSRVTGVGETSSRRTPKSSAGRGGRTTKRASKAKKSSGARAKSGGAAKTGRRSS
jgi:glucose-6-phosphate dehydrogenase assembly protein OpcA